MKNTNVEISNIEIAIFYYSTQEINYSKRFEVFQVL